MPPCPVRSTNSFQHLLILSIDINTQIILPGKERGIHIIDEDRDIENVIITLDMRKPDLPCGKTLKFFYHQRRIIHSVLTDILPEINPASAGTPHR
jgi:hypothetical protein